MILQPESPKEIANKPSRQEDVIQSGLPQIISDLEIVARLHLEQTEAAEQEEAPHEPESRDMASPVKADKVVEVTSLAQDAEFDISLEPGSIEIINETIVDEIFPPKAETTTLPEIVTLEPLAAEQLVQPEPLQQELGEDALELPEPRAEDFYEQENIIGQQVIEDSVFPVETAPDSLELEPTSLTENTVLEIFENIEMRISELEPETAEATNDILGKIVELTREIQNPEITAESFEEAEGELIELCTDLFERLGLNYSKEEIEQVAKLWIVHSRLNPVAEGQKDDEVSHLFDDMGTHEGLKHFMVGLKRIKRVVEVLYSALGKFALDVFQSHESKILTRGARL